VLSPGQFLNIQVTRLIGVFKTSTWEQKKSHNMQNCIRSTDIRLLPNTAMFFLLPTHTQYFQLQVGIPWNNKIMGEIVQPCYFITGYFSEWKAWDKKKAYTTKEDGILAANLSTFFKEKKRKTVKSHLSETYHRFRFGVGHQTGKEILFVNLINNVSVVSHRYRHFLHHFGKVSARSTERDRWALRNEGGREEGRRRRELTSLPRPGPVEKFFSPPWGGK